MSSIVTLINEQRDLNLKLIKDTDVPVIKKTDLLRTLTSLHQICNYYSPSNHQASNHSHQSIKFKTLQQFFLKFPKGKFLVIFQNHDDKLRDYTLQLLKEKDLNYHSFLNQKVDSKNAERIIKTNNANIILMNIEQIAKDVAGFTQISFDYVIFFDIYFSFRNFDLLKIFSSFATKSFVNVLMTNNTIEEFIISILARDILNGNDLVVVEPNSSENSANEQIDNISTAKKYLLDYEDLPYLLNSKTHFSTFKSGWLCETDIINWNFVVSALTMPKENCATWKNFLYNPLHIQLFLSQNKPVFFSGVGQIIHQAEQACVETPFWCV